LNEAEQTGNIREACKRNNITETTFYRWRSKFGGMEVSDAKRLRELEQENAQLKRMVADLSLDNRMLKDLNSKKWCAWRNDDAERCISRPSTAYPNAGPARSWGSR
jgi:putative transposase